MGDWPPTYRNFTVKNHKWWHMITKQWMGWGTQFSDKPSWRIVFFLRYGNPFETVMTWQADRKNVVFYWLLSDSVLGSKFAYFASQTTDLHRTDCEWDDVQPPPHQSPGLISTVVSIHGILKYIIYVIFCVYSVYIYTSYHISLFNIPIIP